MSEEDLNVKYIREKTGLVENDELIPIILEMIQESYKAGLCQAEYDNTMGLIEENQQLKEQLEASEKARKEAIKLVKDSSLEINTREYGNLTVVNSDDILDTLDIDKGE